MAVNSGRGNSSSVKQVSEPLSPSEIHTEDLGDDGEFVSVIQTSSTMFAEGVPSSEELNPQPVPSPTPMQMSLTEGHFSATPKAANSPLNADHKHQLPGNDEAVIGPEVQSGEDDPHQCEPQLLDEGIPTAHTVLPPPPNKRRSLPTEPNPFEDKLGGAAVPSFLQISAAQSSMHRVIPLPPNRRRSLIKESTGEKEEPKESSFFSCFGNCFKGLNFFGEKPKKDEENRPSVDFELPDMDSFRAQDSLPNTPDTLSKRGHGRHVSG